MSAAQTAVRTRRPSAFRGLLTALAAALVLGGAVAAGTDAGQRGAVGTAASGDSLIWG
ncbi:hypothetical protein [Streptomyces xanthii]|uniref:Uncharacterized protein n=1 Tax=Streptomyces xanthii TaxID=2768069 RepID=A0A7H1B984_9ACTN|nr:hypothetical protein [Streptomyces xanthii]QNS05289.1 hypothetical protein IAG42_17895 [Streptomyces xanthii]